MSNQKQEKEKEQENGNNLVDTTHKNYAFELEQAKAEIITLKSKCDALEKANRELVSVMDEQNRAKLMKQLVDVTKLSYEQMNRMSTDELLGLVESYRLLKQPYASVRATGDEELKGDSKLTVPNKFRFTQSNR